jgi:hypothetical protein
MRIHLATGLLLAVALHAAEPLRFESGSSQVALIELYTSEGCSSCPPADRWLGSLRDKPGLWKEFVPVEFHVNYWDSLGWKDRLSTGSFTAREYAYASAWGSGSVYTPCFVRNGAPWRPLTGATGGPGGPAAIVGVLSVEVGDDGVCRAEFTPAAGPAPGLHEIHVALLGGGIASRVTAGENRGQTLGHEFVVLGIANKDLFRDPGPAERAAVALPRPIAADTVRRAIAAWVTLQGELAPIQATGGWLSGSAPALPIP